MATQPTRTIGSGRTFSRQPSSGVDWASFDPEAWWQTPGLDQSWFQESPGGWGLAAPDRDPLSLNPDLYPTVSDREGRFDPWETYQSYWEEGLGPEWQAALDRPFSEPGRGGKDAGRDRGRGGGGDLWGPFEPLQIPGIPEEDLARFQQWIDEVSGAYKARLEPGFSIWDPELTARVTERTSPEYTGFSPEQRGAFEENIGGQLALARRGIGEQMAQRGIRGSGLEAQLGMTAAGQAARGMGDIRAALASSDETTRTAALQSLAQMQAADEASRQWATQGLEGVRRFGLTAQQGMTSDAQNMLLNFAQMTGMPTMLGPEQHLIDPLGLSEMGMSREDAMRMMLMNFLQAQEGPSFPEAYGATEGIDNPWAQLLALFSGLAA